MTVVRELIAKFGIDFDQSGANQAEKSLDGIKGKAKGATSGVAGLSAGFAALGSVISAGAIVVGLKSVITAASDSEETLNLLKESFGKNQKAVLDWAQSYGDAAGRSVNMMQELAGKMGSLLTPLMEGNKDAAADMSTKMAELAIDMGSFFNAADEDALAALRSGLTGELEPLKKFGVIMSQDALDAFAMSQGIRKNVKDMTTAEKTQLRYNFILANTKIVQGDAKRTAEGFANMMKRLQGQLKDAAVAAGKVLLPALQKFMKLLSPLFAKLGQLMKNTSVVKGAMVGLGVAMVALGIAAAVSMAPALLAFGKLALVVTAVSLIATDFFNLMSGGNSVIGTIINSIFGPGSATEAVTFLKEAWTELSAVLSTYIIPYLKFVASYWATIGAVVWTFIKGPLRVVGFQLKVVFGIFKLLFGFITKVAIPAFSKLSKGFIQVATKIKGYLQPVIDTLGKGLNTVLGALDRAGNWAAGAGDSLFGPDTPSTPTPAGAGAGGGGGGAPIINQTNTVNVNGNASPETAAATAKKVGNEAGSGTKRALNSLTHKGGA